MTDSPQPRPADNLSQDDATSTELKPFGGKRQVRAAALGLLAVAALIVIVTLFSRDEDSTAGSGEELTVPGSVVTTEVPTPADDAAPTAIESSQVDPESEPSSPTALPTDSTEGQEAEKTPDEVTVLITSQAWNGQDMTIEVVGSVQGIATEISTCTAAAALGGVTQLATVNGTFDGVGTSCGLISIPMHGQPSGTYQVIITFDSAAGQVDSEPVNVTVP